MNKEKCGNSVQQRIYLKGLLTAKSPFLISTDDDYFDLAPLKDELGNPFIPGTSVAGVLRDLVEDEKKENYFGYVLENTQQSKQSLFITYDCFITEDCQPKYTIRDGIKLVDGKKITQKGAKISYKMVDPGCTFKFKLEIVIREDDNLKECIGLAYALLKKMQEGFLLGAKSNRGLGLFELSDIFAFNIEKENAYEKYVNFDWDKSEFKKLDGELTVASTGAAFKLKKGFEKLSFKCKCSGTLLIRNYDTSLDVDSSMVTVGEKPTIPGSSWSGLFRHQAKKILINLGCSKEQIQNLISSIFGSEFQGTKDKQIASNIVFADSIVEPENYKSFVQTNVKINRFTQGAANTALYNSRPIADFETQLNISLKNSEQWMLDLIKLVIFDINEGYIALGGQTSIGRGILKLTENKLLQDDGFSALNKKLEEWKAVDNNA